MFIFGVIVVLYFIKLAPYSFISWLPTVGSLRLAYKLAPYSFRSVSWKFCPRVRLIVLHATHVLDVARVVGFLKLRRDIHARAFVGLSTGHARKLKS
jgi:hypothetical protein